MCHQLDSVPPVSVIAGGSSDHRHLTLTGADGNEFAVFEANAAEPKGPAIVILPDVRGLYRFYEELALRFAEHGYDAVAIDYFGRTAGVGTRDDDFDFWPHVEQTTFEGIRADVAAAVAHVRGDAAKRAIYTVGFCFGGSNSWHQAANGHGLAGAIGFYGHPNWPGFPNGAAGVVDRVAEIECPILGFMGGADESIPEKEVEGFRTALTAAGKEHDITIHPGAPHSYFDRHMVQHRDIARIDWLRILDFVAP